jgi:hypothetical protein
LTIAGLAAGLFLATAGAVPPLWGGEWAPGKGQDRLDPDTRREIGAVLVGESQTFGQFRALWVGDEWFGRAYGALPVENYLLTGPQGPVLNDLFTRGGGQARESFNSAYASVEEGLTDRGGALLGAFNVRLIVLQPDDPNLDDWLAQRDLGVIRRGEDYVLMRNNAALSRMAIYEEAPRVLSALDQRDTALASGGTPEPVELGEQLSGNEFHAEDVAGPSTAFLAETRHVDWEAEADDQELERTEGGWANAFSVDEADSDVVVVENPRSTGELVWRIAMLLIWIALIGLAFPRTSGRSGSRPKALT